MDNMLVLLTVVLILFGASIFYGLRLLKYLVEKNIEKQDKTKKNVDK